MIAPIKKKKISSLLSTIIFIFIIYNVNANVLSPDYSLGINNNLRQLTTNTSKSEQTVDGSKMKNFQLKWMVLKHLISQTYVGTWEIESNNTYTNFTNNKGTIQIVFNYLKRTHIQGTFYYDYDLALFDGEDNRQSIIISNSYFFTIAKENPVIEYDNTTNILSINDQFQSSISQYKYLALISHDIIDDNITMGYHSNKTWYNLNKELNGIIGIKDLNIVFNAKQIMPSFYQSVSTFSSWLSILGMIQAFYFNYQLKLFNNFPDEAFKYSPYTFVLNCLYNGLIGFECFLAAMINERLFYIFIVPAIIYFVNFAFIELKVILLTMNIHQRYDLRQSSVLISVKSRLIHFCILFYFLLICLFIYSFDVFFWKSVSLFIVLNTFIPQIIYGIKKSQSASIIYISLVSLNKLYIPIYFRTEGNFLYFKPDHMFITSISIVLFIEILLLLFQRLLWRHNSHRRSQSQSQVRNKKKTTNNKLYKTIEELKKKNIDIINMKCSICLGDLNAANQLKANPANSSLLTIEEDKNNISSDANSKSTDTKHLLSNKRVCCKNAFKCFKVKGHKEEPLMVMMTHCKHIFHIECLEEWLKIKYSCPQCRCIIPQIN